MGESDCLESARKACSGMDDADICKDDNFRQAIMEKFNVTPLENPENNLLFLTLPLQQILPRENKRKILFLDYFSIRCSKTMKTIYNLNILGNYGSAHP